MGWAKSQPEFCMRKWGFASLGEAVKGINKEVEEGDPADCKDLGEEPHRRGEAAACWRKQRGFFPSFEITGEQAMGTSR